MSAEGGITTVTHGDFNVSSTGTTPEKLREALNVGREPESEETPDLSKAASDLGKKGGEAAAKARKAKPIPPKEKADAKGDADTSRASEATERASTVDAGGSGDAEEVAAETESEEERKSRARQRVEEATRREAQLKRDLRAAQERHEAETRELRERLDRIERGGKPPEQTRQEQAEQAAPSKPRSEDFENYEEYLDARDKWNRDQWTSEASRNFQAHTQASRYAQESQGMVTGWQGELNKAAAEDPEFRSKVAPVLDRIPLPSRFLTEGQRPDAANWIADDLMSAPADAKVVLRHFAENPGELERIASLQSPRAVTRELAKIVALSGDATSGNPPPERPASKPEQSNAQPPVRPVTGTPAVAGGPRFKPGMSLDDYARGWKP